MTLSLTGGAEVSRGRAAGAVISAESPHGAACAPCRQPGWEKRLSDFIRSRRRTPFAWGTHDCCTFAAAWVGQATGTEPFPDLRAHRTGLAAARALRRHGCLTAEDIAAKALGPELPRPSFAQRGDIVAVDQAGRPALGICLGTTVALAARDGLIFVPLSLASSAWRV